jgi:hypothetical protein
MDAFLAPSTRLRDRYPSLVDLVEVELKGGMAGEILLHRGFMLEEFYSVADENSIVWINPDVLLAGVMYIPTGGWLTRVIILLIDVS